MNGSRLVIVLALALALSACSILEGLAAPEDGVRIEASNESDQTAFISSGSFHDRVEPGEFWTWTEDRDRLSRVWVVETEREIAEREFPEGYERVTIEILSGGAIILR